MNTLAIVRWSYDDELHAATTMHVVDGGSLNPSDLTFDDGMSITDFFKTQTDITIQQFIAAFPNAMRPDALDRLVFESKEYQEALEALDWDSHLIYQSLPAYDQLRLIVHMPIRVYVRLKQDRGNPPTFDREIA